MHLNLNQEKTEFLGLENFPPVYSAEIVAGEILRQPELGLGDCSQHTHGAIDLVRM